MQGGAIRTTAAVLELRACQQPSSSPLCSPRLRARRLSPVPSLSQQGEWLSGFMSLKKALFKILKISQEVPVTLLPLPQPVCSWVNIIIFLLSWGNSESRDKEPETAHRLHTHRFVFGRSGAASHAVVCENLWGGNALKVLKRWTLL